MANVFDNTIPNIVNDRTIAYSIVLSQDPDRLPDVRALIDTYVAASHEMQALGYLNDLKRWIGNAEKSKRFLDSLHKDAKKTGGHAGANTWRNKAWTGRIMRYSARWVTAKNRFDAALKKMGNISNPANSADAPEMADVWADYAELLVYLGYPQLGIDALANISAPNASVNYWKGWHYWVMAFAHHQLAFVLQNPFETFDPGAPSSSPGPESNYSDSNGFLDLVLQDAKLSDQEKTDSYLLRAANWGAMCLWRNTNGGDSDAALDEAANALQIFKGELPLPSTGEISADPINVEWSWEKEKRGRFCLTYHKKIDGALLPVTKVIAWREAGREHFHQNLAQAGLQDSYKGSGGSLMDGEVDTEENHADDDGD